MTTMKQIVRSQVKETTPSAEQKMASIVPLATPPNGGFTAWAQVLASFLMFLSSWGVLNSFGVLQTFYEQNLLSSYSSSDIAWIGTVQGFVMIFFGVVTGPVYDRGYIKTLVGAGLSLNVLGLMTASVATKYYSIFLSLAVTTGLGSACLFVPSVALVSAYFTTKRPIATCLASLGASVGGIIYPIVFQRIIDASGHGWAFRAIGFINAFVLVVAWLIARPLKNAPGMKRKLFDVTAFHDPAFVLFCLGPFFAFLGFFVPFFYLPIYAETRLAASPRIAFYLVAIINAGSVPGRVVPSLLALRFGALRILVICGMFVGVIGFVWPKISNVPGIIVYAAIYGFFYGSNVSLSFPSLVEISPDLRVVGARFGMFFGVMSFGLLIGAPIAGVIAQQPNGFLYQSVLGGLSLLMSTALLLGAYLVHRMQLTRKRVEANSAQSPILSPESSEKQKIVKESSV